jgi:two-component system, chemotaxis family, sensor kinase Cph1
MGSLLGSLLHSYRVGRMELTLEDVDLSGVLAEAIEMVGQRSEDSTGETKFVVPRPLQTTRCERARCREILLRLLSDALKCIDEPRKIIEVGYIGPGESHARPGCPEDRAGKIICYRKDNGIGIQPKHHDQIL